MKQNNLPSEDIIYWRKKKHAHRGPSSRVFAQPAVQFLWSTAKKRFCFHRKKLTNVHVPFCETAVHENWMYDLHIILVWSTNILKKKYFFNSCKDQDWPIGDSRVFADHLIISVVQHARRRLSFHMIFQSLVDELHCSCSVTSTNHGPYQCILQMLLLR